MNRGVAGNKSNVSSDTSRKQETKKSNNRMGLLIVGLVILILVILLGWKIGRALSKDDKGSNNDDIVEEEVVDPNLVIEKDTRDGKYKRLINNIISSNGCFGIEELAHNNPVYAGGISNTRAFQIASSRLLLQGVDNVSLDAFIGTVQHLLGSEYVFDIDAVDFSSLGCSEYTYNSSKKTFKKQKKCTYDCGMYTNRYKIVRAYEQNSQLFLDVYVIYGSEENQKFYSDFFRTIEVENATVENADLYFGRGTKYKITFQIVDGHEVFVSSELVEE